MATQYEPTFSTHAEIMDRVRSERESSPGYIPTVLKKVAKDIYNATPTRVKAGAVLGGLATFNPWGIVAGAITGGILSKKNAERVGKVVSTFSDAAEYEAIDPSARYAPKSQHGRIYNAVQGIRTTARNARVLNRLEKLATEASEKTGKTVTPATIYASMQAQREKEKKIKEFNDISKQAREYWIRFQTELQAGTPLTSEQVNRIQVYNNLVNRQYSLGNDLDVNDPSKYFQPIRVQRNQTPQANAAPQTPQTNYNPNPAGAKGYSPKPKSRRRAKKWAKNARSNKKRAQTPTASSGSI